MDLQTLSTLDDLLSDVLLDGIHLWFQTHKMSKDYRPLGIPPGKILDIIQRKVIFERKLPEAVKDLLEIDPIKGMFTKEKEIQDFGTHARRYLSIYLPSAGFEISQTDRYSAVTNKSEACVIANRPFEVGDELQYCAGTIANLTEQEEKDLETKTSDFSVIKTSRRGTCLFLGPARFVNHDCDPNCSFMSAGSSAIYFKVQKPISINDEITTHYGDNYFGVDNQECLCATCDRLGQGGYKDKKPVAQEEVDEEISEPEQEDAGRRLRNRRGKPINYYPTLMKKGPRKVKESSVRPSTPLPPVESDTIPSINTSPAPTTNSDSDTVVNPPSEQGSVLGECGSISVSPVTSLTALSTTPSEIPPIPLAEPDTTLLPSCVASPVPDGMELQTDTPPFHTSTTNSGSKQPASSASPDQLGTMKNVHSQSSALAIEAPDHPLQAISRTIDTLSLDDNSPFVESSSSSSSSSLKGVTPLTNNPHTTHNSPSVDSATGTSKSSIMDGLPLPDIPPVIDNSSDNTSLTSNPSAVDKGQAMQTIQPALEISESLPMDPMEVDSRSDQGEDPMLIGMMTSLELFGMRDAKGAKLEDVDELSRATVGSDAVDPEEDDPAFSDQFEGDLSDAGIDEETPFSPKNFRMSFEFLLSNTAAHASSEESGDHLDPRVACRSDTANEGSRQASVQLSEGGDEAVRTSQKRIHKRAKPITEILDPNHCATCKTYIPQHERNDANDCRRCYRHFAIYGTAWPSRSRNVIAERYKKAAQEERDREKKRKLAAEAKARQEQVKEEARAKQEKAKLEKAKQELAKKQAKAIALAELELKKQQAQQKIDMRKGMGLSAVEKTKIDRHKQRRMKLSVMPGDPYDGYLDQVDRSTQPFRYEGMTPSMANADMVCVNGQVIYPQYPHMTYQGNPQSTYQGSPHSTYQGTTSNPPGPYQQDYYYPIQQGYPPEGMIPPTMPPHPFHSAPYIVFVDPMDDSDEFWWPAVTVPLHQWDPATMPDYSQDEDHVLVRFLEDCTYANCSIAGLMLFHKELEPYASYVKRGREFAKNGAMKRALALFEDDIMPPRFRWKNMSWENQKDLAEVLSEIHHSRRMREANIHMKLQRLQAELHQSTHNLQLMRNDPSNDPFHIQARELELEREYHFKVDQLRHKIQDVGGSLDYFNKNSAMMRQVGPTFIRNNSMDIPHLQVQQIQQFQQHPPPATKAKRSRKPKPSSQPDDSQQSMELTPTWQSMEPIPSKSPKEPKEPVDPNNAKPKKARGPSKRKIQIDLQLEEHRQLISAASMGLTSFKTANGTVFALASPSQIEDSVAQPTFATSKKKRAGSKSRASGDDGPDQVTLDPSEGSTDQPISNNATATSTTAPKARKRRADRQTVDVAFLDAPVALPIMTLPRSISLEPSGHQLVVMDPSSRFSSLPALLKTNGSRGPLSPNWTIHDHEYRVTEQRLIGGHYNCFEITLQPERAGFVQKSQDGDMFLFDSNDMSEASTPSSSDSTETDLSLHHGGTPEPTEIWSKRSMARKDSRRYTDEDEDDVAGYITEGDAYVDGEVSDNMDARSTADTFGTGELSSMAPSSSSSSLGEGDRDVDVDGYETQDVDIEGLTDQDQEAVMCLLELTKLSAPAPQRAPPMGVWEVKATVPHYDRTNTQETSYTIATPKRAPKKKRTKKSRQPSATPNAATSSLSSPSLAPATTESTPEQVPTSEASQAQSRRGKKQPGKPRKASSAKSKVVVRGVKRQNPGTDVDGNLPLDHVTGDEERVSVDKERITEHTRKPVTQEKATPTQQQWSKKRSLKETEILQNGATQADGSAVLAAGSATAVSKFAATPPSSSLWFSSRPWTGLPVPFSSLSGSDVADNKELQSLMQWSIKGDLVGFDLDSSVRSVRSRTRKSESPVVVSAKDLAQPKATKGGSASKPRVADKIVNEPKRKPKKRRKLTSEEEKTQNRAGTESTAPGTTKIEEVVGDSTSIVGGEPEERGVVARGKASKDTESPTPETEEDEESSDDAATTVDPGSNGKDTQGEKLTVLATADDKETSDDPRPPVDNIIDQSRISTGKVTVLRKAPAVVVVSFTLLPQDYPGESDIPEVDAKTRGRRVTTDAPGRFTTGSKTVPSSSGEMLRKRGRKKKMPVELPDDPALQRPVAMSTRKRIRQDTADIELALEEELIVTRYTASKAKGHATDVLATALGAKVVKRRRVRRSSKSKENEISLTQEDEAPSDEDETPSRQDEAASAEDESSSEEEDEEEASSEKDETSTDSEEDSDTPVGPPVRRQSLRLGRADIAEQAALSRRGSRSSAKSKATRKKNQTKENGDKEDLPLTFGVSFAITTYNIAEGGRLRIRDKEVKGPNTSTPKFEVGDSVVAPGEDNLMFDGVIKDRRDHKTLPEVYEYKIHYDGYASKYDAWIEERMLQGE